jgi:hypothetical protein
LGDIRNALAFRREVDQAVLPRFINGKSGLSLATIDKLMAGLDIGVRLRRKTKDK